MILRRTGRELVYVVAGAPLAVLGCGYVLLALLASSVLAITAVGVPLLAVAVQGSLAFGLLHRWLARLIGEDVGEPVRPRRGSGPFGRLQAMLGDGAAWRASGYLVAKLPVTMVQLYVVAITWGWGLIALTYPIQHALRINDLQTRDSHGVLRHGIVINGVIFDSWPRQLLVSVSGVLLLVVAPYALHAVVLLDRLLIRLLLGSDERAARIHDLEETRAQAVDDAVAVLRRIERDLHDGAQARLIALTMQLTMVREAVPAGPARDLADQAAGTAREAITELRELVRGIHPPVLDQGLDVALASISAGASVTVDVPVRPTAAIESIAYFCAAELLTNAARHASASEVRLDVYQRDDRLLLRAYDDGVGGARVGAGSGLSGLVERIRTVDGSLAVDSPAGGPTVVTVDLPTRA